ncbi:MAG TPA: hypothetical protein VM784_01060 [Actinomycetota bacterium]|nr:hypothetical protein [Actinomycetota bacterium]
MIIDSPLAERARAAAKDVKLKEAIRQLRNIETAIEEQRKGAIRAVHARLGVKTEPWEWRKGTPHGGNPVPLFDWHAHIDGLDFVYRATGSLQRDLNVIVVCPACGSRARQDEDIRSLVHLGRVLNEAGCDCVEKVNDALEQVDIEERRRIRHEAVKTLADLEQRSYGA